MIQDNDLYTFTIDNDSIRALVPFDLTDDDCESIACELDCHFEGFVATWAREWRTNHPNIVNHCEVVATLHRQIWEGPMEDRLHEVGETEFECQDALDKYELSELPPYADDLHDKGALDCGDELFFTSVSMGLVADWDGPFDLYIDDEQYEWYLDDRVLREYGYEPREED